MAHRGSGLFSGYCYLAHGKGSNKPHTEKPTAGALVAQYHPRISLSSKGFGSDQNPLYQSISWDAITFEL
ncbi:conserved hypothetical protein [Ricinus communis]|uniref:Uncharacterized protein n=1 Tax=Ricinus communis TaxID=3988 RepID=B9RD32_RICCO|nr:conserved hypothetical protein [Ricinus communis]